MDGKGVVRGGVCQAPFPIGEVEEDASPPSLGAAPDGVSPVGAWKSCKGDSPPAMLAGPSELAAIHRRTGPAELIRPDPGACLTNYQDSLPSLGRGDPPLKL